MQDTDMSGEATYLSRRNILTQSSTAMLAQANLSQRLVLDLLKGI